MDYNELEIFFLPTTLSFSIPPFPFFTSFFFLFFTQSMVLSFRSLALISEIFVFSFSFQSSLCVLSFYSFVCYQFLNLNSINNLHQNCSTLSINNSRQTIGDKFDTIKGSQSSIEDPKMMATTFLETFL